MEKISYNGKLRRLWKSLAVLAMGNKCHCCGYNRCQGSLDFHHAQESKKHFSISNELRVGISPRRWNSIFAKELRKCILVCKNCHYEIHAGVREIPKIKKHFNEKYAKINSLAEVRIIMSESINT
jgi:hypothetical protein